MFLVLTQLAKLKEQLGFSFLGLEAAELHQRYLLSCLCCKGKGCSGGLDLQSQVPETVGQPRVVGGIQCKLAPLVRAFLKTLFLVHQPLRCSTVDIVMDRSGETNP